MGKTRSSESNGQRLSVKPKKGRLRKEGTHGKRDGAASARIRLVDPVADAGLLDGSGEAPKPTVILADASTQTIDLTRTSLEVLRDETERHLTVLADLQQTLESNRPVLVSVSAPPAPEDYQTCGICSNAYENRSRLPVCLPCGHTLCKVCTGKMRSGSHYTCPYDRREFALSSDLLPVNLLLLNAVDTSQKRRQPTCEVHNSPVMSFCCSDRSPLCSICLFAHKDHDCCLCDSPEAEDRARKTLEALKAVQEKAHCREVYWKQALFNFHELYYLLEATALATSVNFKRSMPWVVFATYPEHVYQQTVPLLLHLNLALQGLIEKLKAHSDALTMQSEAFPRLSLVDKLSVQVRDVYDSYEMLEYLQHFGLTIKQANEFQLQ